MKGLKDHWIEIGLLACFTYGGQAEGFIVGILFLLTGWAIGRFVEG